MIIQRLWNVDYRPLGAIKAVLSLASGGGTWTVVLSELGLALTG